MDVRLHHHDSPKIDDFLAILEVDFPDIRTEFDRVCHILREQPQMAGQQIGDRKQRAVILPVDGLAQAAVVVFEWERQHNYIDVYVLGVLRAGKDWHEEARTLLQV